MEYETEISDQQTLFENDITSQQESFEDTMTARATAFETEMLENFNEFVERSGGAFYEEPETIVLY